MLSFAGAVHRRHHCGTDCPLRCGESVLLLARGRRRDLCRDVMTGAANVSAATLTMSQSLAAQCGQRSLARLCSSTMCTGDTRGATPGVGGLTQRVCFERGVRFEEWVCLCHGIPHPLVRDCGSTAVRGKRTSPPHRLRVIAIRPRSVSLHGRLRHGRQHPLVSALRCRERQHGIVVRAPRKELCYWRCRVRRECRHRLRSRLRAEWNRCGRGLARHVRGECERDHRRDAAPHLRLVCAECNTREMTHATQSRHVRRPWRCTLQQGAVRHCALCQPNVGLEGPACSVADGPTRRTCTFEWAVPDIDSADAQSCAKPSRNSPASSSSVSPRGSHEATPMEN